MSLLLQLTNYLLLFNFSSSYVFSLLTFGHFSSCRFTDFFFQVNTTYLISQRNCEINLNNATVSGLTHFMILRYLLSSLFLRWFSQRRQKVGGTSREKREDNKQLIKYLSRFFHRKKRKQNMYD